jgi:tight adherence protein C
MDIWWIKALGFLLFFAGVFAGVYFMLPRPSLAKDQAREAHEPEDLSGESPGLAGLFKPFYRLLVAPAAAVLPLGYARTLKSSLTTAGIERKISPEEFAAFQGFMLCFFCLLGWLFKPQFSMVLCFGLLGVFYPYWWLLDKKHTRQKAITTAMPDSVDMLALSTASGLDFLAGMRRICELTAAHDPFVAELLIAYQNIKLGMSTEDALKTMALRVDTPEMHAFVSILIQAQKMGSSISEVLKAQAVRMRQDRFMRAEKAGAVATQKLLLPLVLLLFPIIFGVIFGPYVLKYIYSR